jgi:hypothetical protein
MRAQEASGETLLPRSGLLARDCFRVPCRGGRLDFWVDLPLVGGVDEKLFLQ